MHRPILAVVRMALILAPLTALGFDGQASDDDLLLPDEPSSVEGDLLLTPATDSSPSSADDGDLLLQDPSEVQDDLLAVPAGAARQAEEPAADDAREAHARLFLENRFPSATTCATCHPKHYRDWSVSAHAYSLISPMFNAMSAEFIRRLSGTGGDFCVRCHSQVASQLGEDLFMPMLDRHPAALEGITCIVCHRVNRRYGRISGRSAIVEGDVTQPVYGPSGNETLRDVLDNPADFRVVTDPQASGRKIHRDAIEFDVIETSGFCGTCHDVPIPNGLRGQEAFTQYKNSPAADRGESCQDCHMGTVPGLASGYEHLPAAIVGDQATPPRKHTNHRFAGPDYSIVHPGIFPHNPKAQELATAYEWLDFDYEAGWGSDAFEDSVSDTAEFPPRWQYVDDRYDARAIIEEQYALLEELNVERYQVMRRGYQLGEFRVTRNDHKGLRFQLDVVNGTDGHGVPTGFDVHRLSYLEVVVVDADGSIVFQSGDRDPNGDVRDSFSTYVRNWEVPKDRQLFSLMSKNVTSPIRGSDMATVLAIPQSPDVLPYFRPAGRSTMLYGRPPVARKQTNVIPPLASRTARYKVDRNELTGRAPYTIRMRLITQMVPVNLVADIQGVGYDYRLSAREVARRVVEGAQVLYDKTVVVEQGQLPVIDFTPSEEEIMAPPPADTGIRYPGLQYGRVGQVPRQAAINGGR